MSSTAEDVAALVAQGCELAAEAIESGRVPTIQEAEEEVDASGTEERHYVRVTLTDGSIWTAEIRAGGPAAVNAETAQKQLEAWVRLLESDGWRLGTSYSGKVRLVAVRDEECIEVILA